MKKYIALSAIFSSIFLFLPIFQNTISAKDLKARQNRSVLTNDYQQIDINNISAWITNYGSIFRNPTTGNSGFEWPKDGGVYAIYASGLWMGAKVNNEVRVAMAEYNYEFGPGSIDPITHLPNDPNDPRYVVYKFNKGDMIPQQAVEDGCPNEVLGDQMLWCVYNDADPVYHNKMHTAPLGVEIQQTVIGRSASGTIGNMIFLRWLIINKSGQRLDSAYISAWSDPDLGNSGDDFVGCDTSLSLGFCYNSNNNDGQYGISPPAVGYDFLQGPIVPSSGDSAIFLGRLITGYRNLPMTSFVYYNNSNEINGNPQTGGEVYNYMQARWRDGTPITNDGGTGIGSGPVTKFMLTGDPEAGTGWLDSAPADRRFIMSSGPFTMMPGDSQEAVVGVLISRGITNLNSVTLLKQEDIILQTFYNNLSNVFPPKVSTKVNFPNSSQAQIRVQTNISEATQVTADFYSHSGEFVGSLTLFDDGLHNDEMSNDNIWGNAIEVDRQQNALYIDLNVDYSSLGNVTWPAIKRNITVVGSVIIPNAIVGADNINGDGLINPGEVVRYILQLQNLAQAFLYDVQLEQLSTLEENYVQNLIAPNGNKVFPTINMLQKTSWIYNPDSAYYQFYLSGDAPPNDSVHIKFKISDANFNVWYDTMAFNVNPIPNIPQYGTMNLLYGFTEGRLGYMLIDPNLLTDHNYRIYFHEYLDNLVYDLEDYTANDTLIQNNDFPDIYSFNSPIVDGFKVTQGTATNVAYANDWEWIPSNQRWLGGGNHGLAIFFGSADLGKHFFGSTLKDWQYKNVSIMFDAALITNCKVYRRDLGYTVQSGLGTFYGEAYDILDPNNPRRLNIVFMEDNTQKPADMVWNPDTTDQGAREYLYIMNSDYDPVTAGGYDDHNWGPSADVLFAYLPRLEPGHTFLENPAELKLYVNPELVHDGVVYGFTPMWTGIDNGVNIPRRFALAQNYPNPFNPTTNIQFSIPKNVKVKLEIFNVLGQRVNRLINEAMTADDYEIRWDGRNESGDLLGSGIYFYRLRAGNYIKTRKMILLK